MQAARRPTFRAGMLLEFDVSRFTRQCSVTGRNLEPGEIYFSSLEVAGAQIARHDFSAESWPGPPEDALGWWRSRVPDANAKRAKLAPNEVLLELFDELSNQSDADETRYIVALLLIRRRVFREEPHEASAGPELPGVDCEAEQAHEHLSVFCPRRDQTYRMRVATPDAARTEQIQAHLVDLLYADAA